MEPQPNIPALRTVGLTHRYGHHLALDNLNIQINYGEVLGYIGPNGAGKTTTFRILSGMMDASAGQAFIGGHEVGGDRDRIKQLVGYLPDNFGVYPNLQVWEYLDFFAAAHRIPAKQRPERINTCLDIVGVADWRDKLMGALSRGMKQRVGIAQALLHDPQVLILDEPAATLDPRARIEMRHLLRQLAARGRAVLVSSHILLELADVCDRVAILSQGKLVAYGPVREVLKGVRQRRLIEVHTLGAADAARRVLQAAPGTWQVVVEPSSNGTLRFEVDADESQLCEALHLLHQERVPVLSFHEVPPDLEDVFMSVTK
jgi:ABC-2 type transport system ATP-binding protein